MAKGELKNAGKLMKIRLRNTRKVWIIPAVICAAVFFGTVIPALVNVFTYQDMVQGVVLQDYSTYFLIALPIIIIILESMYIHTNRKYAAYPQTNTGRFLAEQGLYHIYMTAAAAASAILYLIQYGLFAVIAAACSNVKLTFTFSLGFVITGFFAMILYLFLLSAMISLIVALIRKFRIYAVIVIAAFGIWIVDCFYNYYFTNKSNDIVYYCRAILKWLIYEKSIPLFFIKGIGIWIIVWGLAFIINKFTVYYKSSMKVAAPIVAVISIISVIVFLFFSLFTASVISTSANRNYNSWSPEKHEIIIDASGIISGSTVVIKTSNIVTVPMFTGYTVDSGKMYMSIDDQLSRQLSHFSGRQICIDYTIGGYGIGGVEVFSLSDPCLTARLDGNTLYLDYSYTKNTKAVVIPAWSFMTQFDEFQNKNIFPYGKVWNGYYSGGDIYMTVE